MFRIEWNCVFTFLKITSLNCIDENKDSNYYEGQCNSGNKQEVEREERFYKNRKTLQVLIFP